MRRPSAREARGRLQPVLPRRRSRASVRTEVRRKHDSRMTQNLQKTPVPLLKDNERDNRCRGRIPEVHVGIRTSFDSRRGDSGVIHISTVLIITVIKTFYIYETRSPYKKERSQSLPEAPRCMRIDVGHSASSVDYRQKQYIQERKGIEASPKLMRARAKPGRDARSSRTRRARRKSPNRSKLEIL